MTPALPQSFDLAVRAAVATGRGGLRGTASQAAGAALRAPPEPASFSGAFAVVGAQSLRMALAAKQSLKTGQVVHAHYNWAEWRQMGGMND